MNNLGVGCPPAQGGSDMMFMFLMLMIMCPGMFGQMGNNSMMMLLLVFMMFSGGMM